MVSPEPAILTSNVTYQLKRYERPRWCMDGTPEPAVTTASEWFSKLFPEHAERWGCPFMEAKYQDHLDNQRVIPVQPNEEFFAAILGGDGKLNHQVVFYLPEEQFYFKDIRDDGLFKLTSEAKLRTLLSMNFLKCAEDLPSNADKVKLFRDCRSDQQLQRIVMKARSILAADKSFFGLDSPHTRAEGMESYGKAAKTFINIYVEVNPQKSFTVAESYAVFRQFCEEHGLVVMDLRLFRELLSNLIRQEYGLGLRNDVANVEGKQQRGWRGIGLRQQELPVQLLERN